MSKVRDRGGGPLVIHRCFVQSRYEVEFAATAYEIIVPTARCELANGMGRARPITGAATATLRDRRCV